MYSHLPIVLVKLIAFITFLNLLSVFIDSVMLSRHKGWLYNKLIALWDFIDNKKIADFPVVTANITLKIKNSIFGNDVISVRGIAVTIILSVLLTTAALSFDAIRTGNLPVIENFFSSLFYKHQLYMPVLYATNFIYDFATLSVTVVILQLVSTHGTSIKGFALIIADSLFAYLLAAFCLYSVIFISSKYAHFWVLSTFKDDAISIMRATLDSIQDDGLLLHVMDNLWSTIRAILSLGAEGNTYHPMSLASASTLAPTIIYLLILLMLMVSKLVVSASKSGVQYTIESATEADASKANMPEKFNPFTILGRILSLIIGFFALIYFLLLPSK